MATWLLPSDTAAQCGAFFVTCDAFLQECHKTCWFVVHRRSASVRACHLAANLAQFISAFAGHLWQQYGEVLQQQNSLACADLYDLVADMRKLRIGLDARNSLVHALAAHGEPPVFGPPSPQELADVVARCVQFLHAVLDTLLASLPNGLADFVEGRQFLFQWARFTRQARALH